ncbi:MAG: sugar porter family MFS transporter [Candidatus Nanopelagicales bacterium]|nr:sugar porter family MFS transporter [Candidatus Nanopelagicales bacterium]MCU0298526.1 sugar porter family MFS transporter [Candidatus Nanopelagicales bacterium]
MAHGPLPGAGETGPVAEEKYHTGRVLRMAIVAALGGFLFGFDSAVVNGTVDALKAKFDIGGLIGFVVAIALLGSAVGAWFAGPLANRFGRRRVMVMAAVLFLIAAVGQAFPFGVADLMFWRFIGGAGIGIASVIAPMYIAEIAPAQLRGRLGSLQQLAIVLGIFTTALTNYFILNAASAGKPETNANNTWLLGLEAWQWMFLVMLVPAIVYGTLALTIPESPRYLVAVGKDEEAAQVLSTVLDGDQHAKVAEIKESLAGDHKPKFGDLKGKAMGLQPIVWIGIGLSVFQQFVGINVIFYYSNSIWASVGFDESQAFLITLITNTTNVVVTLVAISLVDRIGRKPLLLVGSAGMAVTLGIMALLFGTADTCTQALVDAGQAGCSGAESIGTPYLTGAAGPMAVVAANLYVVFFGVSWGPVVWVLLGEMFPNRIRAAALAVAAAAQWLANFIVSVSFPGLSDIGLGFAYGVFTVFAVLSFFFVTKFIRETKGMSLEDMQDA